ncbi:hypothetical protein [Acrocarpospora sp. B8E8]|uniref:hypothetical protein n=1 Tax=Acrocarpospora sp. B8E8 TaxID=3153572 RepID=UPI00325EAF3D
MPCSRASAAFGGLPETTSRPVRLAVLSSYTLAREALSSWIAGHPDFILLGQAASWRHLRELCARHRIDAVLVEVDTLCPQSIQALGEFRASAPLIQVVLAYSGLSPEGV